MNKTIITILTLAMIATAFYLMKENTELKKTAPKNQPNELSKSKRRQINVGIATRELVLAESKLKMLVPQKWHTYQENTNNGYNYYITPYNYEDLNTFKRGMAVTVIRSVSKSEGVTPEELALIYIENAKKARPKLKLRKVDVKHLKGYRFELEEKKGLKNSLVTSLFFVADNKNDLFYTFIFQYEKLRWNAMRPIRNTIFKNIKFIQ